MVLLYVVKMVMKELKYKKIQRNYVWLCVDSHLAAVQIGFWEKYLLLKLSLSLSLSCEEIKWFSLRLSYLVVSVVFLFWRLWHVGYQYCSFKGHLLVYMMESTFQANRPLLLVEPRRPWCTYLRISVVLSCLFVDDIVTWGAL